MKNPGASVRISLAKALQLPPQIFATEDEIDWQKTNESLVAMLTRHGIDENVALLIVGSIRNRSKEKIMRAMKKERVSK